MKKRKAKKERAPSRLSFWWDFSSPGEMPLVLESNHPHLPYTLAVFEGDSAIGDAERAIRRLESDLDVHMRMSPERILRRINRILSETNRP